MHHTTPMTTDDLARRIGSGDVDTVVVAFTDIQGRLVGKRVTGSFWLDHVREHGIEACDYLFTVDVALTPLDGFRFADWESGYGDVTVVPDITTVRAMSWAPRSVLVLGDVVDVDHGAPVEISPRRVLQHQVERAAEQGIGVKMAAEIEFYLFADSYAAAAAKGYRDLTPGASGILDYQLRAGGADEPVIADIRAALEAAGVPVEMSKGEAGRGQHEINLRYTDAVEMADRCVIYKTAVKEVAAAHGRSATFMAKPVMAESGSSCHVHISTWELGGKRALMWDDSAGPDSQGGPSTHFDQFLGGLVAGAGDLALMWAPTMNSYKRFQGASWAPTTIAWGRDNRTCGFRSVGVGASHRIECRIPGADVNPYLAFAAVLAGGLHGLTHELSAGPPLQGNAYADRGAEDDGRLGSNRLPASLVDAVDRFAASDLVAEAFGDDVRYHLGHMGRAEWAAFHQMVSDFELTRNFEEI